MSCGAIGIPLLFVLSMILSENRYPLFRIMHSAFRLSMIPRVKPEGMLFGKPDSAVGSKPEGELFRIKLWRHSPDMLIAFADRTRSLFDHQAGGDYGG